MNGFSLNCRDSFLNTSMFDIHEMVEKVIATSSHSNNQIPASVTLKLHIQIIVGRKRYPQVAGTHMVGQ